MFDMLALVVLFLVLIGTLALFQFLPRLFRSRNPALARRLLEEWLQAHDVELPSVAGIIAILNQQLEKGLDSEELEHMCISGLLPKTELPKFSIYQAELSADNTDVMLCCTAEWPTCLPGVRVEVKEKDNPDTVVCHFAIDWMTAQMKVALSDQGGDVLLSYENTQPFRMGVSCRVAEGFPKDPDRMASQVADTLQLTLMGLSLDRVSVSMATKHTPTAATIPQLLISLVEEDSLKSGGQGDGHQPTSLSETRLSNGVIKEGLLYDVEEKEEKEEETVEAHKEMIRPVAESAVSANEKGVDTPSPSSSQGSRVDEDNGTESDPALSSAPDLSPLIAATGMPDGSTMATSASNHLTDDTEDAQPSPPPRDSHGNGLVRDHSIEVFSPSPDSSQLPSPRWRRTPSYEQLEEIGLEGEAPGGSLKQRSSSTDHLSSPTRLAYVSGPTSKNSLTLSIAGSEAESMYGADERIPSMLVFEIEEVGGRVRHIVAVNTPHAIKLRQHYKSAKKLHIYNDHLFIASKLKHKAECAVCKEKLNKLFGKKGYMCRCCEMMVHKQCHWKVEDVCENSTVHSMKLLYPEDKDSSNSVVSSP